MNGYLACALLLSAACAGCSTTGTESDEGETQRTPDGMVLIRAAGSQFSLGSTSDGDPTNDTAHAVELTYDFWIDSIEVTQTEYAGLMSVNPSSVVSEPHPVYNVTWYDAALYCNARSRRDGLDTVYAYDSVSGTPGSGCALVGCVPHYGRNGYRLPSEAEWEFVARAGSAGDAPWGEMSDALTDSFAWHMENSGMQIHEPARLRRNQLGVYDMFGNVREWCTDWFALFPAVPTTDPFGPDSGRTKVLRNGDAFSDRNYLRTAYRNSIGPMRTGSSATGFRVVRVRR